MNSPKPTPKHILLLFSETGGGHRSAAEAIAGADMIVAATTSATACLARDACDGSRGRCGTFSSCNLARALLGKDNASLFLLGASNLEDLLVGAAFYLLD